MSTGIFFQANERPIAKLAISTRPPVEEQAHGEQRHAAEHERPRDDALAREPSVEPSHGGEPEEHAHPAGADQPRERAHALVEALLEDDERENEHESLPHLVDRDRGDRADGPRGTNDVADPVRELHADPPDLVSEELRGLGELMRPKVATDRDRDARRDQPGGRGDRDDRDVPVGVGHESPREDPDEQRDRAADRRDRVRGQEILGRNQPRHHGLCGREEEPVHRDDPQRPRVEQERATVGVQQDEEGGCGAQDRRDHHDLAARPSVDEDPREGPEDRERDDHDRRRQREARRGRRSLGREDERGDERRLDEPVGGLAHEPDPQEPPEVGVAQRIANAPHLPGHGPSVLAVASETPPEMPIRGGCDASSTSSRPCC